MKDKIFGYLGIEFYRVSHTEKLVSALGSFLGILLVFYTSIYFVQGTAQYLIVASMGASAVLLFAVPHGPLSQPWSVIGGHLVSAFVGVSCAKLIPDPVLAASVAVGIAVGSMYYLHCIHPPGGATALSAVVATSEIQQLGYQFILTPVLINVAAIMIVAVTFNYCFHWRRYPAYLAKKQSRENETASGDSYGAITHKDFVYALSEFESFVDISETDLLKIYERVTQRHKSSNFQQDDLILGNYYSNGKHGDLWAVRQIVDWADNKQMNHSNSGEEKLIYKVIAGTNRRSSDVISKNEFCRWAKYEVSRDENNWRRVDTND